MLIRTEIPIDASKIDRLLHNVFGADEAELVAQLREDGLLTLGVVATDDEGDVIGYAAFSPVTVMDEDRQWVGLAPVAVDERYQRQGIGKSVIYEGLDSLNEFGYAAVVVLGDPEYYRKLGFVKATDFGLSCKWSGCETTFQIYVLSNDSIEGISGLVSYSAPFERFS